MPLSDALKITIGLDSVPVTGQGFGTVLVLSASAAFAERVRYYTSAAEVLADPDAGFTTASIEYLAAVAMFSQSSPRPPDRIGIGRLDSLVARIRRIQITGTTDGVYEVALTFMGITKTASFTAAGNTVTEIRDGLEAAIELLEWNDVVRFAGTDVAADSLDIAINVAGADFTMTVNGPGAPDIVIDPTTTDPVGVVTGLTEILAVDATGWYGVVFPGAADVLDYDLAIFTETLEKLCGVMSTGANPVDISKTEDLLSLLQALSLVRCVPCYHSDGAANGRLLASAILANRLVNNPDNTSTIFAFAEIAGVPIDTFADSTATVNTQQTALESKNGNYYGEDGAGGEFYPGTAPGGQWLDLVISRDWLQFRLLERYKAIRKRFTNIGSKVPQTDAGVTIYENATRAQIDRGIEIDHFSAEPAPVYNFPTRATMTDADISNRVLRFNFAVEPAGAIQGVDGTGNIGPITGEVTTAI